MRDHNDWNTLSEQQNDVWIGVLFTAWFTINFNTLSIIKFFIDLQTVRPYRYPLATSMLPYIFVFAPGMWVLIRIFKRSFPIYLEMILILGMFILSFSLSGQPSSYIDNFIKDPELKALCYQTISTLMNVSQLLLLPIWYIVRFRKETPYKMSSRNSRHTAYFYMIAGTFILRLILLIMKATHIFHIL